MARRPFRVEVNYPVGRKAQYFLTRDVKVGNRRAKVKKYLGTRAPSAADVARLRRQFAPEMEYRTALKRADLSAERYRPEHLPRDLLLAVERVKSIYQSIQGLLTVNEIEAYESQFEVSYVQGTTAIEGNTLTVDEARELLIDGVMPSGKALREVNEIQNFRKVARYRNAYSRRVSLDFVRNLHALVMDNIDRESAGTFRRRDDLGITGFDLPVTASSIIPTALQGIIDAYYSAVDAGKHPLEQASTFHYRFEMIHPFTDGNGRVGREVFNYMLSRAKYPRLLFLGKDRTRYLDCLSAGNRDDLAGLASGFARLIVDQRLAILERRLKQVAVPTKRVGQTRLSDFVNQ